MIYITSRTSNVKCHNNLSSRLNLESRWTTICQIRKAVGTRAFQRWKRFSTGTIFLVSRISRSVSVINRLSTLNVQHTLAPLLTTGCCLIAAMSSSSLSKTWTCPTYLTFGSPINVLCSTKWNRQPTPTHSRCCTSAFDSDFSTGRWRIDWIRILLIATRTALLFRGSSPCLRCFRLRAVVTRQQPKGNPSAATRRNCWLGSYPTA